MDEVQVIVPIALKSKLTETLKQTLLNEIGQNISRVEHDMTQLEFEMNGKLQEQAKINVQGVGPLRAQFEAQKARMQQMKDKLSADKEHLEKLAIGAEINRAPINRLVTLHVGDDMNALVGGEILVEDGKIVAFRD
ncbi:MAG: YlqD family protein [Dialister sp.]|nr:YlqD family protein [Dialister sp.]